MSHLRFFNGQPRTLSGILEYTLPEEDTPSIGINLYPDTAYEEMQAVKEIFRKPGGRKYKHYVLSFEEEVQLPAETLLEIGHKIGQYFADEYQLLISAHQNTDNLHLHFVQNTINMLTGKKLNLTKGDMLDVKIHANKVLAEYQLNPIDLHNTPAALAKTQNQTIQ